MWVSFMQHFVHWIGRFENIVGELIAAGCYTIKLLLAVVQGLFVAWFCVY